MRDTKTITLPITKQKVEIVSFLTWGDKQKIEGALYGGIETTGQSVSFNGASLLESKYTAIEVAVQSITNGQEKITFSRDWLNELPVQDGDFLFEAVDELGKKK